VGGLDALRGDEASDSAAMVIENVTPAMPSTEDAIAESIERAPSTTPP